MGNQFKQKFKFDTVHVYYKTKPVKKCSKHAISKFSKNTSSTKLNTHESALSPQKRSEFPICEIRRKNFGNQRLQYLWKCLAIYINEKNLHKIFLSHFNNKNVTIYAITWKCLLLKIFLQYLPKNLFSKFSVKIFHRQKIITHKHFSNQWYI